MLPLPPLLRISWPASWRVLTVLALYAIYLPLSGYTQAHFRFDAAEYWDLSLKFTQLGRFSLLAFDDPLRGYLGPLLVLPARLLCHYTGCSILTATKVLGAGWAALLFGVAIPELWAQVSGRAVAGGRWLVLVGLSFAFWRDYFVFPLTDMPALTLLLLSLAALGRRELGWAALAGLLAGAVNLRPIYLATVPGFLASAYYYLVVRKRSWSHAAAAAAVAVALLLPQFLINQKHFGQRTPLVLSHLNGMQTNDLYLEKLNWGLQHQKYETTYGTDYPATVMFFRDQAGTQLLQEAGDGRFLRYWPYARVLLSHPVQAVGILARRLFNGLDVQYPTPYVREVYRPTWALAGLNYTMWFGALLVMARAKPRRWKPDAWLVLAALLVPCLAVLPMSMECRFLLPLHLLLCATLSLGWPRDWTVHSFFRLRATRLTLLVAAYLVFVGLCFMASAAAQATLEYGPRHLF